MKSSYEGLSQQENPWLPYKSVSNITDHYPATAVYVSKITGVNVPIILKRVDLICYYDGGTNTVFISNNGVPYSEKDLTFPSSQLDSHG